MTASATVPPRSNLRQVEDKIRQCAERQECGCRRENDVYVKGSDPDRVLDPKIAASLTAQSIERGLTSVLALLDDLRARRDFQRTFTARQRDEKGSPETFVYRMNLVCRDRIQHEADHQSSHSERNNQLESDRGPADSGDGERHHGHRERTSQPVADDPARISRRHGCLQLAVCR